MPEQEQPKQLEAIAMDQEALIRSGQAISDAYALAQVVETYDRYSTFRFQNHDSRWVDADALYLAWVPQRVWEGTNIPRSSLGSFLVFTHVETAIPSIVTALTGGDSAFQVYPGAGADVFQARVAEDAMRAVLDDNKYEQLLPLAVKQALLCGNGGLEWMWEPVLKSLKLRWVDIRDFFFDPKCPTPDIEGSRSVIRRTYMTLSEIRALRGAPGFNVPADPVLMLLCNTPTSALADQTVRQSEALRGIHYDPTFHAHVPQPADRQCEILIEYRKDRVIWVANRQVVLYNGKNPYGFFPFMFAPCWPYLGRFYALSFCDVVGPYQLYTQGIKNARLDNINLLNNPPRAMQLGGNAPASRSKWFPGSTFFVDDPKNVQILTGQGNVVDTEGEIAYMEVMAEKASGVNSVGMGVPRPGNANRTAGGMQNQLAGSSSRLSAIVKNFEDYLVVPMLEKGLAMMRYHLKDAEYVRTLSPDGEEAMFQASVLRSPVKFKMIGSSKMVTADKLQSIFPTLMQFISQGPFMQSLQSQGQTVDWNVMLQVMQDATGTADRYQLIRPLNEQEQQAMAEPPPEVRAQQEAKQRAEETRLQIMQMKMEGQAASEDKLAEREMAKADREDARLELELLAKAMMEREKSKADQQKNAAGAQAIIAKAKADIQAKREQAQVDLQVKQQQMQMKAMEGSMKLRMKQQEVQGDLQAQGLKIRGDLQHQQAMQGIERQRALQGLVQDRAMGDQKLQHSKAAGEQAIDFAKRKAQRPRNRQE